MRKKSKTSTPSSVPKSKRSRKPSYLNVSKKLQIELQSLLAYACYDSDEMLNSGKSLRKAELINLLEEMYQPSTRKNNKRICEVDKFLLGLEKYEFFFERKNEDGTLIIPEVFHRMSGKEIFVGKTCVSRSLLTSKSLIESIDIKAERLWQHAQNVSKNMKKALSICMDSTSPYKDFEGSFESGKNWNDYADWIRLKMYESENDLDLDDDDEEDKDDFSDFEENDDDNIPNTKIQTPDETNGDNKSDDQSSSSSKINSDVKNLDLYVPDGTYFKGYFAFLLFRFIPPPGGEKYKSNTMFSNKSIMNSMRNPGGRK